MSLSSALPDLIAAFAMQPWLLVPVIVLATLVLEDVATITVGVLASRMVVDPALAVTALVIGTVLGDIGLYLIARRARHWRLAHVILRKVDAAPITRWLQHHALLMLVVARFTPGTRLPVFAGAGAIAVPFLPFSGVIIGTTLLWTPGLYLLAAKADMHVGSHAEGWIWVMPVLLVGGVLLAARGASKGLARIAAGSSTVATATSI